MLRVKAYEVTCQNALKNFGADWQNFVQLRRREWYVQEESYVNLFLLLCVRETRCGLAIRHGIGEL